MATKTQVRRALDRIGATWDERYDTLDAPPFHVWKSNGGHGIAVVYDLNEGQRASDRWEFYLEEVRFGVEPCNIPDCDTCREDLEDLHKEEH